MMFGLVLILVLALAFNLLIFTIFPLLLIFFFYHTTNDNTTKRKEKPMLQTPLIAKIWRFSSFAVPLRIS